MAEEFFFSSRRRHTRLVSDWSSDVCSSDLGLGDHRADPNVTVRDVISAVIAKTGENIRVKRFARFVLGQDGAPKGTRSEERRVGKECRDAGAREQERTRVIAKQEGNQRDDG